MASEHYENFPVGSFIIPRPLRRAIHQIYQFARTADDIADEGNLSTSERLIQLDTLEQAIKAWPKVQDDPPPILKNQTAIFQNLFDAHALPKQPFLKLLLAFKWDVSLSAGTKKIENKLDLYTYCDHSANPIGELLLRLFNAPLQATLPYANALCTSLQLLNFWQDFSQDFHLRQRVYIPLSVLKKVDLNPESLFDPMMRPTLAQLLQQEIKTAQNLLLQSRPLRKKVPFLLACEIRAIQTGGWTLAEKLKKRDTALEIRPTLSLKDSCQLAHAFVFALS